MGIIINWVNKFGLLFGCVSFVVYFFDFLFELWFWYVLVGVNLFNLWFIIWFDINIGMCWCLLCIVIVWLIILGIIVEDFD